MDENMGSFKSLDEVHLKATQNIEVNGRTFEEGETIVYFDKIQISGLNEIKDFVSARGGFDNRSHVYWETTEGLKLTFSQGVFSNTQFAVLNNAKMIKYNEGEPILITKTETLEANEVGNIYTTYEAQDQIFVYDANTGEKLTWWKVGNFLKTDHANLDVFVKYRYKYIDGASVAQIGQACLRGFLELEGKTKVKDDVSGLVTTGIIKIPKLKLTSGLSMRLGAQANPVVGTFTGIGVPVESRHNSYVMEIDFLEHDIDSDM